jgi:hypothetical protein
MWNRTALLAAVLAFALPALADEPSKLVHKNAHPLAPKTTAPKSPKNLNNQEHMSATFGKESVANLSSKAWSESSQGTKHKHKPANNGKLQLKSWRPPPK